MNCILPFLFFGVKSPRFPASRADHDWLHPRDAGPGIPSQLAAVTSRASSAAQGRSRGGCRGAPGGASLGVSRETLQQMACLAELQRHICSTAGGKVIFGKSLLSQVQLVLISFFPPFNQRFYFSPTSFCFLEMKFLCLLQGHYPADPNSLTNVKPHVCPHSPFFFFFLIFPFSLPVTLCKLSRWPVEYKGKCC